MRKGWRNNYYRREDGRVFRIDTKPVGDIRRHVDSDDCWCQPDIRKVLRARLVIHKPADGRDLIERHGLQ